MSQSRVDLSKRGKAAASCLGPGNRHLALVVGHPGCTGGMESFCRFLAESVLEAGWQVTVALSCENIYESLQARFPQQIHVERVDWIDATCAGDRDYAWSTIALRRRWFKRVQPDVALIVQSSNTPFRCAVAGARLAGVPAVVTHRTMAWPVEDVPSSRHFFGLIRGIGLHRRRVVAKTWLVGRLASRLVYNSAAVGREYEALYHYPHARGVVIPNAVDCSGEQASSRPDSQVTIGFVGRIGGDKRLDVLLRAVAAIPSRNRARLLVYGEGAEQSQLAALAEELSIADWVQWRGVTRNPAAAYADMDMVVLCSPRESSSNMVLEAMAAGKAVVVTDVGGMPELVENGQCGVCVPALDVAALSHAIEDLVNSPDRRRELGERARSKAAREHDPRAIASQWVSLLSEVADRQAPEASRVIDREWTIPKPLAVSR